MRKLLQRGVKCVGLNEQLERWCWSPRRPSLTGSDLASLAASLSGPPQERSRSRMRSDVARALGSQGGISAAHQEKLDAYMEEQIAKSSGQHAEPAASQKQSGKAAPDRGAGARLRTGGDEKNGSSPGAGANRLRDCARAMLRDSTAGQADAIDDDNEQAADSVATVRSFFDFARSLRARTSGAPSGGASQGAGDAGGHAQGSSGNQAEPGTGGAPRPAPGSGRLHPAERFRRIHAAHSEREMFDGTDAESADSDYAGENARLPHRFGDSLLTRVEELEKHYARLQKKISSAIRREVSDDDIDAAIERLVQEGFISPSLHDSFYINRDLFVYQLARKAFYSLKGRLPTVHYRRHGTHDRGSRGMHRTMPDRVRRARRTGPHLAAVHTLRRSLARRTIYPESAAVDEQDLMEFDARKKVGYRIVIALDVSGAVQFGRRIQRVRKACLAFGYYLKRFHPRDRVSYIAYHEHPRCISFADTARLKAVNGAGKDIGSCLLECRQVLKKDPDRVPAVILIGDGLPVRGSSAGFYRFHENNSDIIEKAYCQSRLLRKHNVLFTFMQFRDDRYLWRDYADETAHNIARCARGTLLQIDSGDIAPTLVRAYDRITNVP